MKFTLLFVLTILIEFEIYSQNLDWAVQYDVNISSNQTNLDNQNNVYSIGTFNGYIDFNPNSGKDLLHSESSSNLFISKTNDKGQHLWSKNIGGTGVLNLNSFRINSKNEIIILGTFKGLADFDYRFTKYNLNSPDTFNIYICKLDSNGEILWAKQLPSSAQSSNYFQDFLLDDLDNIYVKSYFNDTIDLNPDSSIKAMFYPASSNDLFILKLNINGDFQWAKTFSNTISYSPIVFTIDPNKNIYLAGSYQNNFDFDPDLNSIVNLPGSGNFLLKLDQNCNYNFVKKVTNTNDIEHIKSDKLGNIYFFSRYNDSILFNKNIDSIKFKAKYSRAAYLSKYDTDGQFLWAKNIMGKNHVYTEGITFDFNENPIVIGTFGDSTYFDYGNIDSIINTKVSSNTYICKYNEANGNLIWFYPLISSIRSYGHDIHYGQQNQIYASGFFNGICDFDNGIGQQKLIANNNNSYILKLFDSTNTSSSINNLKEEYNHIEIYPNPAKNKLFFESESKINQVKILNSLGLEVLNYSKKDNFEYLDISHLPNGSYFIKLIDKKGELFVSKIAISN